MDGDEVAQLYVRRINAANNEPVRQLKNFKRVQLAAGRSERVSLLLRESDLKYWDEKTNGWMVYPGEYEIRIGGSSEDSRLSYKISIK